VFNELFSNLETHIWTGRPFKFENDASSSENQRCSKESETSNVERTQLS
jgi:hypothetical protein